MKVIGFAAVLYLVSIVAADGGGGGGGSESEAPKEQSQSGDGEHSSLDGRIPALDSAGASSAGTRSDSSRTSLPACIFESSCAIYTQVRARLSKWHPTSKPTDPSQERETQAHIMKQLMERKNRAWQFIECSEQVSAEATRDMIAASYKLPSEKEEIPDPARWLHQAQVADSARIAYLKATSIKKAADKYDQDAHKYHDDAARKLSKTQEKLMGATESLDSELSGNLREIQMQLPDSDDHSGLIRNLGLIIDQRQEERNQYQSYYNKAHEDRNGFLRESAKKSPEFPVFGNKKGTAEMEQFKRKLDKQTSENMIRTFSTFMGIESYNIVGQSILKCAKKRHQQWIDINDVSSVYKETAF
ncbi:hypothetical protein BSLG_010275 [Batrachochytrium salamandrivorans]|nr:hypothetical protein BSLG_010275 [Batrachochytrium salamandrivorans]